MNQISSITDSPSPPSPSVPTLLEAAERILGSSSSGVPVDVPDMPGVKCYLVSIVGMQALAEAVSRERKAVGK